MSRCKATDQILTTLTPSDIILGVTHLLVNGRPERLLKCPFCNFRNIHEDTITHHIQYTDDVKHDVDINHIDKSQYIVTRTANNESPYGPYLSKAELKLPWIRCLWCNYRDKIEFDLSLHFLESHKAELMTIPITRRERLAAKALIKDPAARFFAKFESPMEYRLDKAVSIAKQKSFSPVPNGEVSKNVP
jgi:sarcosine oxidase delta subunit